MANIIPLGLSSDATAAIILPDNFSDGMDRIMLRASFQVETGNITLPVRSWEEMADIMHKAPSQVATVNIIPRALFQEETDGIIAVAHSQDGMVAITSKALSQEPTVDTIHAALFQVYTVAMKSPKAWRKLREEIRGTLQPRSRQNA